ncbi:hypothetical protein B0H14DRAFT_2635753 [Mycena olivaceomarginata]|nr:hypothetical protein B0H14DRAFT_2635753 [Mycena olivaceomarginata]
MGDETAGSEEGIRTGEIGNQGFLIGLSSIRCRESKNWKRNLLIFAVAISKLLVSVSKRKVELTYLLERNEFQRLQLELEKVQTNSTDIHDAYKTFETFEGSDNLRFDHDSHRLINLAEQAKCEGVKIWSRESTHEADIAAEKAECHRAKISSGWTSTHEAPADIVDEENLRCEANGPQKHKLLNPYSVTYSDMHPSIHSIVHRAPPTVPLCLFTLVSFSVRNLGDVQARYELQSEQLQGGGLTVPGDGDVCSRIPRTLCMH